MFKSLGSQIFFKNSILLEILERTLKSDIYYARKDFRFE